MASFYKYADVAAASEILDCHPITVYRLAQRGQIPAIKMGGRWKFRVDLLTSYIEQEMQRQMQARRAWYPRYWSPASLLPR